MCGCDSSNSLCCHQTLNLVNPNNWRQSKTVSSTAELTYSLRSFQIKSTALFLKYWHNIRLLWVQYRLSICLVSAQYWYSIFWWIVIYFSMKAEKNLSLLNIKVLKTMLDAHLLFPNWEVMDLWMSGLWPCPPPLLVQGLTVNDQLASR